MTHEEAIEYVKTYLLDEKNNIEALENLIPELKKSEDEKMKEAIIATIHLYYGEPLEDEAKQMIAWLEKQCNTDIEQVFRPLAGCYIEDAARQAVERQKQGKNVVLAFNGCYIPVKIYNTADAIEKEYRNRLEKARREYYNFVRQEATSKISHSKQKPIDKIEPKFKVGDWVVWDNKISCHVDNIYQGKESLMYTITDTNNMTRSYSIKSFDNNAHLWTIQDAKDGDVLVTDISRTTT